MPVLWWKLFLEFFLLQLSAENRWWKLVSISKNLLNLVSLKVKKSWIQELNSDGKTYNEGLTANIPSDMSVNTIPHPSQNRKYGSHDLGNVNTSKRITCETHRVTISNITKGVGGYQGYLLSDDQTNSFKTTDCKML